MEEVPQRLLSTEEAAQYLGSTASALRNQRFSDRRPGNLGIRVNHHQVRYDVQELDAWLDQQKRDRDEARKARKALVQ